MISSNPSQRLVKHIIRSYARLTDNYLARHILKENIPPVMREKNFINSLDESSKRWMMNLMKALSEKSQITQINQVQTPNAGMQGMNMGMMPGMVMGQLQMGQIPAQQGYMMSQQPNDYSYGMYGENYMGNPTPKGMFGMPQTGMGGKTYGNVNPFYNYKS